MGQILPIAVRCNMEDEDDTIIVIEQPELHLHPAAHNCVAAMFANTSLSNNHRYIIETHSKNILLGIRSAVVDKSIPLKKEDVVIPRAYADYSVEICEEKVPQGVTCIRF